MTQHDDNLLGFRVINIRKLPHCFDQNFSSVLLIDFDIAPAGQRLKEKKQISLLASTHYLCVWAVPVGEQVAPGYPSATSCLVSSIQI